ncbi:glycosyltransferase family 4 protein [Verrucomicrobiaceae bacterium 227]
MTTSKKSLPAIAVVTSTYARSQDDPQVPWMRQQVNRLHERGHDIQVFAPSFKGLGTHGIDGVRVNRFRYCLAKWEDLTHDEGAPNKEKNLAFKIRVLCYLFFGALSVFWWCLRNKVRVLHIHWPFPHGLWGVLPKYFLGVKVVAMSHGAELAIARNSGSVRKVLSWLLRHSDASCVNSSHTANEVKNVSGLTSLITPYGATVQARAHSAASVNDTPTLLFCGRLIQRKGIDVLLRAMVQVLGERPVKLVITGEGDRKPEWQKLCSSLGLDSSVRFAGFVSDAELAELYRTSDLYVHPAIFDDKGDTEGLGVVLIEALAHKLPVVASSVGGIVDVIKHGETGLLVPEKDEAALAQAILKVLDDPALARGLGERGFAHTQRFFDWDRITSEMENIYGDVLMGIEPSILFEASRA